MYAHLRCILPVALLLLGCCSGTSRLYAQLRPAAGQVLTADNQPFPGVTVRVKGASAGATTGPDGRFSIANAPADAVLVFTAIGHLPLEQKMTGTGNMQVQLHPASKQLDEIVSVGYGIARKRDLTGAITSIGRDAIEKRQPVNLIDALQSQAAGVLVMNDAGEPGAEGSIRIRGYSTFSTAGNNPLFVIDGVLSESAGNINPGDIQSIEILKDAASAAIYGSRSANGVIIITTKRGVADKPSLDVRYSSVFGKLAHKLRQANADEVRLYRKLQDTTSSGVSADSLNPGFNADNDYQDIITQTAIRQQVDMSISGAGRNANYYSSIQYLDDKGIVVNSWAKTLKSRVNTEFSLSDKVKAGNRFQLVYQKRNNINEGSTLNQTFQRPTNFYVWLPDGTVAGYLSGRRNPLAHALYETNITEAYGGNAYTFLTVKLAKDLTFNTNFNVDLFAPHNITFSSKLTSAANPTASSGGESFDLNIGWQYQAYMNYARTFRKDHQFTAMAGFSAEKYKGNGFDIGGTNYVSELVYYANAYGKLLNNKTTTKGFAHSMASFFGRVSYSYKSRYMLNATLRHDGSSRFGKNNVWGDFPSVSAAWRFSEEPFMAFARRYLTDAKLRVSYGQTGNERIGDYDAMQRLTFGTYYYNDISGVVPTSDFGNNNLSWESTHHTDIGLDLSLLNDRLTFVADYYIKTTKKLLYSRPLPVETGYDNARINLGSIQNKGLELAVNALAIKKKNFQWSTIFNISFERGIIQQLYNGEQFIAGDKWLVREGGRLGDFYGFRYQGVYQYDQSNAYNDDWEQLSPVFDGNRFTGEYTLNGQKYTGQVHRMYGNGNLLKGGDVIYENANKDSVIDDADRRIIGNSQPTFYAGWINNLTYKNFTLSFTFNLQWGNQVYNNAAAGLNNYTTTHVIPQPYVIYNAWRKQGDITDVPRVDKSTAWNHRISTRYLEDASFIRLSYVKLMYTFQQRWLQRVKMKGAGVYLYGSNLITWTNYSWYDPEFSSANALQMGQDNGRYPRRRELGLGINIHF
ncbi:SusC/RagA family TonB-linked outer membrane protein [Chitinophaga nivalis]|uniref:TonB-dependent receptor n=1 Tax=Chitinophaga nivalis TaxID=2991709 RepID=A0ABT3IEF5_9BACT|nr:TonB-dependent receptor [Chitinophaga nivalis]MCW3467970.1 TonB-dependent receptor [Chitinophaga nivalis]MCW3482339.1 TonB-dependent receptor [Chitinophaga nivalis]